MATLYNRRDRALMRHTRRIWRAVHDELLGAPGWRHCREEWTLTGRLGAAQRATLRVILTGSSLKTDVALRASVEIDGWTSRAGGSAIGGAYRLLKKRGYVELRRARPGEKIYLNKRIGSAGLRAERQVLASLAGAIDEGPRTRLAKDMGESARCFGAGLAGPWLPYRAAWERRRPIWIGGRETDVGLMFHLAPRDLRGLSLGVATSIAIWPPWNGRGQFPKWLEARRTLLAKQFRAAGHRAEWYRGPQGRGLGIMSLVWPRPPVALHRIRLMLDAAELGDLGKEDPAS